MHERDVPAMDTKTNPSIWKLTTSQWSVYYWLLAHSNRNPNGQERHYFIYRNSFTLGQIRDKTGIKSDPTIRTAFAKLKECGAIIEDTRVGAYLLTPPPLYVPMDVSILKSLLGFNKYLDPGIIITTFAILARLSHASEGKSKPSFTKTELGVLLGFAKQHIDDAGIILVLALLSHLGLVKLETAEYNNRLGVRCIRYTIMEVHPDKSLEEYLNEDEEVDETRIQRLWEMICSEQMEE